MLRTITLVLILSVPYITNAESVLVAAASNMSHPMQEIADMFETHYDVNVKLSFGSSGNFTRQILQGAPYQIFLSADKEYIDLLVENGKNLLKKDSFARGRTGIFIPDSSGLSTLHDLKAVIRTIQFGDYNRMAYANPEFAPFGVAARQALTSAGVWVIDSKKSLIGENASQAMQFSLSGRVDFGIIPASYAVLDKIKNKGRFLLIPEHWHKPIEQYIVLLKDDNPSVNMFYDYLLTAEPKQIIRKYGYTVDW